ncbi:MAG TPA: hypothetical protein VJ783_19300 [Pirellulales bacterium]|nr:hypothetical protein [Pirellulales bacterium]
MAELRQQLIQDTANVRVARQGAQVFQIGFKFGVTGDGNNRQGLGIRSVVLGEGQRRAKGERCKDQPNPDRSLHDGSP